MFGKASENCRVNFVRDELEMVLLNRGPGEPYLFETKLGVPSLIEGVSFEDYMFMTRDWWVTSIKTDGVENVLGSIPLQALWNTEVTLVHQAVRELVQISLEWKGKGEAMAPKVKLHVVTAVP